MVSMTLACRHHSLAYRRCSNSFRSLQCFSSSAAPAVLARRAVFRACPSIPEIDGLAYCLLDCADPVRIARIRSREQGQDSASQETLNWAAWLRMHGRHPTWRPDVIQEGVSASSDLYFGRWESWEKGDPRWRVTCIDNSDGKGPNDSCSLHSLEVGQKHSHHPSKISSSLEGTAQAYFDRIQTHQTGHQKPLLAQYHLSSASRHALDHQEA